MFKKIAGIALCLMAFAAPSFAAPQSDVNAGVSQATIQDYFPLWSNTSTTLYADPGFIRYGKSSNPQHKNCEICGVSTLLVTDGDDIAVGNLVIYDFNCKTKKIFSEKRVDLKKGKKISEQKITNPIIVKAAPNNTVEQEIAKLKEIEQLQTFNNAMRFDK